MIALDLDFTFNYAYLLIRDWGEGKMLEEITAATLVYLGKKAIDSLWGNRSGEKLVINNSGIIGSTFYSDRGRTQVPQDTIVLPNQQPFGILIGDIYTPYTLESWMLEQGILLVLILNENSGQAYFFEADLEYGYEITLPYGIYSCFVFLMDSYEDNFFEAEIFAMGSFCREDIDLRQIESFQIDNIWELVDESPVIVNNRGPFYESFILIDTDVEEELPKTFAELIGNNPLPQYVS